MLFDAAGEAVPQVVSQHTYELTTSNEGEVSVDPEMLLNVVAQTIDEVLKVAGSRAAQIKAVATDTFWHTLLGVDAKGHPVTPLITWEDTRAYKASLELRSQLDEKAVHERTGARFHASYWPAKLKWLSEQQPAIVKKVATWLSFGEYMHRQFLGRSVCSLSMASGTGMLVTRERKWDAELIRTVGIAPEQLPKLGDARDSLQGLTLEYAGRWPALHDAPWFPALGDGATACIGSGSASKQNWSLTVGTSSAVRVVVPTQEVVPSDGLWLYLIDAHRAVLGGALSEGGNLFSWVNKTLKVTDLASAEQEAVKISPDGHGLTVLPFISGERSLGWHADARMTMAGLSIHTQPADVLRALTEALALQLAIVYEELMKTLKWQGQAPRLLASGGALVKSDLLRSVIADTVGTPVYPSTDHEASARGAALLALEALGVIADVAQVEPHLTEATQPDTKNKAIYHKAAQRQRELYQLLLHDE
jgi:gluconokinase